MISFASDDAYRAAAADPGRWRARIDAILTRHGLDDRAHGAEPVAATGGSYPLFLLGDLVVKFYGHTGAWREAYNAERVASEILAADPGIAAPRLLATGETGGWPYLVLTRLPGTTWETADMSPAERLSAAAELGAQLSRLHALEPGPDIDRYADKPPPDIAGACTRSALPAHLAAQAEAYVAGLEPFDEAVTHGDLFEGNILVSGGRVTGVIDWGDVMVADRTIELAKIHLSTFACDKDLLRALLDGGSWPVPPHFARQAMGMALIRQAVGLAQHGEGFDNFYLLPRLFPVEDIATLDELADVLFGV